LKVLKVKSVLYVYVSMLGIFIFCENGNSSFFSLLWNHLLILKILTETLFKMLVAAFRKPPVIL
jgi:hypothetical protein